jgi:hypothetical protein
MKALLTVAVLLMSVSAFADWSAKIQCRPVVGKRLVAKAQGTLKVTYDQDLVPNAELVLDSVSLNSGSTFKKMTLQSVEMTTDGDYAFGTFLPIVDHKTVNRIEIDLGETEAISTLETNKGNNYLMKCSYLR